MDIRAPGLSFTRRLIFAVLWVAILDPLVPPLLRKLEKRRYEGTSAFRFHDSDLFGLGSFVAYLRENPKGERARAVFFGNSIIFGWRLDAADSIPGRYERQRPGMRAFNAAINGEALGTNFLIAKAIIDSVDVLFIQVVGERAHPMLPGLIPIEEADARFFRLDTGDPVRNRVQAAARRIWSLYRLHHRLQTAILGTSTHNYLYVHGAALFDPQPQPVRRNHAGRAQLRAPRAVAAFRANRQDEVLRKVAELARSKRKRIVLLEFEYGGRKVPDAPIGAFNRIHEPFAEIVVITIPPELTHDGMHPTSAGSTQIASLLLRHEEQQARLHRIMQGR